MQLYILTNFLAKIKRVNNCKTFAQNNKFIKFKPVDQFKIMFEQILKNYKKNKFKLLNYSLIKKQTLLLDRFDK